eukprot:Clim_evm38s157 gene=Clim_evmTU38s157
MTMDQRDHVGQALGKPLSIGGGIALPHRIVLAPLTRCRADSDTLSPRPQLCGEYYSQRAKCNGLLISEATLISWHAQSTPRTPGIFTEPQQKAWTDIVKRVHGAGGVFFCQLWHTGRAAHSAYYGKNMEEGFKDIRPWSSSTKPIADGTKARNVAGVGTLDREVPHMMSLKEVQVVIQQYVDAALRARAAGFDGVEIHSANGYLPDQFLQNNVNCEREDDYGSAKDPTNVTKRCKFLLEIVDRVITEVWDGQSHRVGVRISPSTNYNDVHDTQRTKLYPYLCRELSKRSIGYLHIVEPRIAGSMDDPNQKADGDDVMRCQTLRPYFDGLIIAAGGLTRETAADLIGKKQCADLAAFGRYFISNPDLPTRLIDGRPLRKYNRDTFYTDGHEGYTTYEPWDESAVDSGLE